MSRYFSLRNTCIWSTNISFRVSAVLHQLAQNSALHQATLLVKTCRDLRSLFCPIVALHISFFFSSPHSVCKVKPLSVLFLQTCTLKQADSFDTEAVPAPAILRRQRFQLSKWFTCIPNNRKKSNASSVKGCGRIINKVCWRALYP